MKSYQILNHSPKSEQAKYSDLQVLQSAAGWYVGTLYYAAGSASVCMAEPGSRDTDYFPSKEAANLALALLLYYASRSTNPTEVVANFDSQLTFLGLNSRDIGYRMSP
jgi:hypothetical protein